MKKPNTCGYFTVVDRMDEVNVNNGIVGGMEHEKIEWMNEV